MSQAAIYDGPRNDEYETPPDLFKKLSEVYIFTLDAAATEETKKADKFFSLEENALSQSWRTERIAWLNPPFSQAKEFFKKCRYEAKQGTKIIAIYKASNLENSTWQDYIFPSASYLKFIKGRTNYCLDGQPTKGVQFGSVLIYYNVKPIDTVVGTVIKLQEC